MTATPEKRTAKKEMLLVLVGVVWVVGAFISAAHQTYVMKRDCVRNEGWLKGWLWCSSEPPRGIQSIMFGALFWPLGLLSDRGASNASETLSQAEFDRSRVGGIYSCWALATRTDQRGDSDTFARVIQLAQRDDVTVRDRHEAFLRFATMHVGELEARGDIGSYYGAACTEPAARMRQAMAQGMLK